MKKITVTLSALMLGVTQAAYTTIFKIEDNSIKFINQKPIEQWIAIAPLESDWINEANPTNCTNWSPDANTVIQGNFFTQIATDCEQTQSRTIQEREQETTTLTIRNVGDLITENQKVVGTDTREIEGTLHPWEEFADAIGISNKWSNLYWGSKNLTQIPSEPYPLTSVGKNLELYANQLTNIDGLRNLTSVGGNVYIHSNQLTNVSGLISLKNVAGNLELYDNRLTNTDGLISLISVGGKIYLHRNQLTSIDGLKNLTSVGSLILYQNQLKNIDGLINVKINNLLSIDSGYSGPKLAASTRFCTLNEPTVFQVGFAQKSQLCNP